MLRLLGDGRQVALRVLVFIAHTSIPQALLDVGVESLETMLALKERGGNCEMATADPVKTHVLDILSSSLYTSVHTSALTVNTDTGVAQACMVCRCTLLSDVT